MRWLACLLLAGCPGPLAHHAPKAQRGAASTDAGREEATRPAARWLPAAPPRWIDERLALYEGARIVREGEDWRPVYGGPPLAKAWLVPQKEGGGYAYLSGDGTRLLSSEEPDGPLTTRCRWSSPPKSIQRHARGGFVVDRGEPVTWSLSWPDCRWVEPMLGAPPEVEPADAGSPLALPPMALAQIERAVSLPDGRALVRMADQLFAAPLELGADTTPWRGPGLRARCSLFNAFDDVLAICANGTKVRGLASRIQMTADDKPYTYALGRGRLVHDGSCSAKGEKPRALDYNNPRVTARACVQSGERSVEVSFEHTARILRWVPGPGSTLLAVDTQGHIVDRGAPRNLAQDQAPTLLQHAQGMDGPLDRRFTITDDGTLVGVNGAGDSLVRVHRSGKLDTFGRDHVYVAWPHVLAFDEGAHRGWQSDNHGASFYPVELPPTHGRVEGGCSRLGCRIEGWIRMGWSFREAPPEGQATKGAEPAPMRLPSARVGASCTPTGKRREQRQSQRMNPGDALLGLHVIRLPPGDGEWRKATVTGRVAIAARENAYLQTWTDVTITHVPPFVMSDRVQTSRFKALSRTVNRGVPVPVLPHQPARPSTWVHGHLQLAPRQVRALPFDLHDITAAAELGDDLIAVLGMVGETPRLVRSTHRGSFEVDVPKGANALALDARGELHLMVTHAEGALAFEVGGSVRRLAGWRTAKPGDDPSCATADDELRALVRLPSAAGSRSWASVRWNDARLCIDDIDQETAHGFRVMHFTPKRDAKEISYDHHRAVHQPLSCTLNVEAQ